MGGLTVFNHKGAIATYEPTDIGAVPPLSREPGSAERVLIENKIREHEQAIAGLAQKIRWLKMELQS
jgi:hypothetical protein